MFEARHKCYLIAVISAVLLSMCACCCATITCSECGYPVVGPGDPIQATFTGGNPDTVCLGSSFTFSVDALDLDWYDDPLCKIQNLDYQWKVNGVVKSGETSSSFTFTPLEAGEYTVQVEVIDPGGPGDDDNKFNTWTVYAIGSRIDYVHVTDYRELRWYCNTTDLFYQVRLKVKDEQPEGTSIVWSVLPTSLAEVALEMDGGMKAYIQAKGTSANRNDITVYCEYSLNGVQCLSNSMRLTSRTPSQSLYCGDEYTNVALMNGFKSTEIYSVIDQFDEPMYRFNACEVFSNRVDDWAGNNWNSDEWSTDETDFLVDVMKVSGYYWPDGSPLIPACQNPGGAHDKVLHQQLDLWVGSTAHDGSGCNLVSVTQQIYRDQGKHE